MSASVDLKGKVAFVAGVADSTGYGWAIAKALAEAGATIIVGTWPPVLKIFQMGLKRGQFDEDSELSDGSKMVSMPVLIMVPTLWYGRWRRFLVVAK